MAGALLSLAGLEPLVVPLVVPEAEVGVSDCCGEELGVTLAGEVGGAGVGTGAGGTGRAEAGVEPGTGAEPGAGTGLKPGTGVEPGAGAGPGPGAGACGEGGRAGGVFASNLFFIWVVLRAMITRSITDS